MTAFLRLRQVNGILSRPKIGGGAACERQHGLAFYMAQPPLWSRLSAAKVNFRHGPGDFCAAFSFLLHIHSGLGHPANTSNGRLWPFETNFNSSF